MLAITVCVCVYEKVHIFDILHIILINIRYVLCPYNEELKYILYENVICQRFYHPIKLK